MKKIKSAQSLQAVFFDFDGVILESVEAKTEAFRTLFSSYPKLQDKIVSYHLKNGGVSRFRKFSHIYRVFLKKPLSTQEKKRLGRRFSEIAFENVLRSKFVPGTVPLLRSLSRRLPLFVMSGTPHRELQRIVDARGLRAYFKGVFGTPPEKETLIRRVLKRNRWSPQSVLVVGDSLSDWKAARKLKAHFVGRASRKGKSDFPRFVDTVTDLRHLGRYLWRRFHL